MPSFVERLSPAPVIWDLSHSAGVARPKGIRFAVGATYKYLNAGPGAPGFYTCARTRSGRT